MAERDPFVARHVESRRGGPAKAPLSRDVIVDEALRQVTANGVEEISLRKVAAALETGPATLYSYVQDLAELRALVLDRALGKVSIVGGKGTWRERLRAVLRSYLSVLSASPGLARLAFGTIAIGPNALRILDTLLGLLAEAGVSPPTAAWAVDLLMLYVTTIAAEQAGGFVQIAADGPIAGALDRASAHDYPHVDAARDSLLRGTGEERFAWAVDVLTDGILQRSVPATPRARKRANRATR